MKTRPSLSIILATLMIGVLTAPLSLTVLATPLETNPAETQDRAVDLRALSVKKRAIRTLQLLAKKQANRREEPSILIRLAEALHDVSLIEFRLAHGAGDPQKRAAASRTHKQTLKESLNTLTRLINVFPSSQYSARALYLRGKTYREMTEYDAAIRDFKSVITRYPSSSDAPFAHLAVWDLLMEQKDYRGVIAAINQYGAKPSDRYYGIAVSRLSWALYYLNDIPGALKFVRMAVSTYAAEARKNRSAVQDLERSLNDATLFYSSGMEKRMPGMDPENAVTFFTSLYGKGDPGKPLVQLAYLLRSKGMDIELQRFKDLALQTNAGDTSKYDLLLLNFEHQLNKRRFARLQNDLNEMLDFIRKSDLIRKNPERIEKSKAILASATATLQSALVDYKERPEGLLIAPTLFSLYEFMLRTSVKDTHTQFKTHFNLAETAYLMKDYEKSIQHYRWIVTYRSSAPPTETKLTDEATHRALSIQFERLKASKEIPVALSAQSIKSTNERNLSTNARNWVDWVDRYPEGGNALPGADLFSFEAARMIYAHGRINDALKRLTDFVEKNPKSQYRIPAAALILDTLIASEAWDDVHGVSKNYLSRKTFSDPTFNQKLETIASDAYFKQIEGLYKNKSYAAVIERADEYLRSFPNGKYRQSSLELAANAALAENNRPLALGYLKTLQSKAPERKDVASIGALTQASVAEDAYDYPTAINEYTKFFALPLSARTAPADDQKAIAQKTLFLAWLSLDRNSFKTLLGQNTVCSIAGDELCARYLNRLRLDQLQGAAEIGPKFAPKLIAEARANAKENNSEGLLVASTLALGGYRSLSLDNRLQVFEWLLRSLEGADPYLRMIALSHLSSRIPLAIALSRSEIRAASRISLDQASIAKRVKLIEKWENGSSTLLKLPLGEARVATLAELSRLYGDLANDIGNLKAPKGLLAEDLAAFSQTIKEAQSSFVTKRDALSQQAQDALDQLGASASVGNVLHASRSMPAVSEHETPGLDFFREVLLAPNVGDTSRSRPLLARAEEAFRRGQWTLLAFLAQESDAKNILPPGYSSAMRGLVFHALGAVSEALAEFTEAKEKLPYANTPRVTFILMSQFFRGGSTKRTSAYVDGMVKAVDKIRERPWVTQKDFAVIDAAARWSGYEDLGSLSRILGGRS